MAGVAIAALGLASCGLDWASTLSIILIGGTVLHFLRLPLITGGPGIRGRLPWILWGLSLAAGPLAFMIVGTVYHHTGPPLPASPDPWPVPLLHRLGAAHQGVSVAASLWVILMSNKLVQRILAWAVVLSFGCIAAYFYLGTYMVVTGWYL